MFHQNVGTLDRAARVLVGAFLLWYGYDHQSWWGLIGLPIALTGLAGTCFLYTLLGMSTCPVKNSTVKTGEVPPITQK